jgi:NADP-dependent 3-hydroxy acid dehydrogenase YdfG
MKKPNDAFHTNKLFNVKGKVPLVTGGGTDIELMPAQALAADGAKVYICGRIEEKLDKIAEIYGKDVAGEIISVVVDMSKKDDIKKLVSESLRRRCVSAF